MNIFYVITFIFAVFFIIRLKHKAKKKQDFKDKQQDKYYLQIPTETLEEMKVHYDIAEIPNLIRILNDCLRIVKTSRNQETVESRLELGAQKAYTLRQLEQIEFYKDTPTSNDYLDVFIGQKNEILKSLKEYKNEIKCNCDGCIYQDECKYGHIIYDEFDNSKMALWEKFHMMHAQNVQTLEQIYLNRANCLKKHMECAEKIKILELINEALDNLFNYCNLCGKCGKAYLKFNKYEIINKNIKQELKEIKKNF